MPLRLYNSLTRRVEPFVPADPRAVTFYTCGPTVYDDAHIGNFRSFLAADVLRRWIESPLCELATDPGDPDNPAKVHRGPRRVVHVMNITDVGHMTDDAEGGEAGEDRMAVAGRRLAEAKKAGKLPAGVEVNPNDPYQIARFYEARFREDAKKLGLKLAAEAEQDPTLMPRATASVPGMIAVIGRLLARGYAYVTGDPGARVVYFDVQRFAQYGRLSGNTLDKLRTGAGGRVSAAHQAQKHHPADFLLWKEDPAHVMKWESPWGRGYPGWHIECTVMSAARLTAGGGLTPEALAALVVENGRPLIDLHSGGEDNIFPHHECEIAQSCCAFNADPDGATPDGGMFAHHWFHPRFLLVEGDKMSKSKGNFYTARDLFARGIEPAAIRLELIRTHYRSNANFTMQGLEDAQRRVQRWRRYARQLLRLQGVSHAMFAPTQPLRRMRFDHVRDMFTNTMNADLNVAGAIGAFDQLHGEAGEALSVIAEAVAESINELTLPKEPVTTADTALLSSIPMTPELADAQLKADPFFTSTKSELALLCLMDWVLGVVFVESTRSTETSLGVFAPGVEPSPEVEAKLRERRDARAARDFKRSDAIRDELAAMGYAIKDLAGGKVEVRRA